MSNGQTAHFGVIEAGEFIFVAYCVGNTALRCDFKGNVYLVI